MYARIYRGQLLALLIELDASNLFSGDWKVWETQLISTPD
jgi:hypothetical protein